MNFSTSSLIRFAGLCRMLFVTLIFGVVAQQAQAQGYQIRAGDTLRIEVLEDSSLNRTVLVAPDGRISMPQAGTLSVRGQSVETCLLYTSPSPRDLSTSRMPSSA